MPESKLTIVLDSLKQSIIEKFDINTSKDIISIHIKSNNDFNNKIKIIFEEVFSFYFINEKEVFRASPCLGYTTLNSIGYYKDGVGEFTNLDSSDDELTEKDISLPNFALELLNSSIFIEAKSIKINDKRFRVGYPSI